LAALTQSSQRPSPPTSAY